MTWPMYSAACRKDVDALLRKGGSLSAYRANPQVGVEPVKDSWAWRLERDIERRFGVRHAVAVNSGTAALHAALSALSLPAGSEIITTPYTFSATVAAILWAGHTPVFADVDPYTFCITPETVKEVLTKKTKAILPVHLFGGLADVEGIKAFGLPVIEDACQAVGARKDGVASGNFGIAGAYSFNGGKNVPAGECGVLVTCTEEVATQARLLMNHGENFGQKSVGLNYRPNELTCCVAWHGLQELKERNYQRQRLATELRLALHTSDIYRLPRLYSCTITTGQEHVWYVFPFLVKPGTREGFIKRMAKRGIPVGAGYITPPLHKYPAFRQYQRVPMPVVEELSSKTLCLLSTLTPDRPLSYARKVAKAMRGALK